ncbi:hypothetical protein CYMTET_6763 [Cymbomonas tetramitiformis]|uniref:Uncharacterized protein n=1 Tax=Cymbomonas tetramitiformis TaxID=36881 RepID=A0AAE0GWK5_9CHLO|nr:hypothetical protein CYMTET_6763 [Cymbomonas tetramitiformis]|eukprot:gene2085-2782_t
MAESERDRKGKRPMPSDEGPDSPLQDEELSDDDEVAMGNRVTVLVNHSEEPVDLLAERQEDLYSVSIPHQVNQWHWPVTHTDCQPAVKKALVNIFKSVEKLAGKTIKDTDKTGKVLGERIIHGECPLGLRLVVPIAHVNDAVMAQPYCVEAYRAY